MMEFTVSTYTIPNRFRLSTAALPCCSASLFPSFTPGYGIEVETVTDNIGLLVGALGATDLTGYNTTGSTPPR